MKRLVLFCAGAVALCAQPMPSPVAYIYVDSAFSGDLTLVATAVSNTYGNYGHTTGAAVVVTSPDLRQAYGSGAWGYLSQASAPISLCAYTCYDGNFLISSDGTMEYCPIASVYITDDKVQQLKPVAPYVYMSSVAWLDPQTGQSKSTLRVNGDSATFMTTAGKSANCNATQARNQANINVPAGMVVTIERGDPQMPGTKLGDFAANGLAAIGFGLTVMDTNTVTGQIRGDGLVINNNGGCDYRDPIKTGTINVQ